MHPVSRVEVPDYYDVVKQPMCWSMIDGKLERNAYIRLADFTVSRVQPRRDHMLIVSETYSWFGKTPFYTTQQTRPSIKQPNGSKSSHNRYWTASLR